MKVLVTAASRHGATAELAAWIAQALRGRGLVVDEVPPADVHDLTAYDGVVIGSAVYEGRWLRPARSLVTRTAGQLADRQVWLFSSGPVGDPPRPAEELDVSAVVARSAALEHRQFTGRLDPDRLGPVEKVVARAVHSTAGDFRDRGAVERWAAEIADRLQPVGVDRAAHTE
jgi:menaquinone-dependent protoporphyrinogen oxidase